MKVGDIVMVVGNLDQRVRQKSDEERVGTITLMYGDEVEVLFENGEIWRGLRREVVKHE